MKDNYERILSMVLKHEGNFSNHPSDPGGATMKGVTQAVYDDYRRRRDLTPRTVKDIGLSELQDIYRTGYWEKVRGDDLPSGVDYAVFDFSVNSGPGRAAKFLQRIVGVEDDGVIGPQTLAAVAIKNRADIVTQLCAARLEFLQGLGTWGTFGRGWTARVDDVLAVSLEMTGNVVIPPVVTAPPTVPPPQTKPGQYPLPEPPTPWWLALLNFILSLFGRKA